MAQGAGSAVVRAAKGLFVVEAAEVVVTGTEDAAVLRLGGGVVAGDG